MFILSSPSGFSEIHSPCLLNIIYGGDVDNDDEEIANMTLLLTMSRAGTVVNTFYIFIEFCQQSKEVATFWVAEGMKRLSNLTKISVPTTFWGGSHFRVSGELPLHHTGIHLFLSVFIGFFSSHFSLWSMYIIWVWMANNDHLIL